MNVDILPYAEVQELLLKEKNRHLLLGNGFSIAYDSGIFSYDRLFEEFIGKLEEPESISSLSERLSTRDFERLIDCLESAIVTAESLENLETTVFSSRCRTLTEQIKEGLADAVGRLHPDDVRSVTEDQSDKVWDFLSNFKRVYTLNYDLLTYWVLMQQLGKTPENEKFKFNDGFSGESQDSRAVVWDPLAKGTTNFYFLHGALHIFHRGHQLVKVTWSKTSVPLKEQFLEYMSDGSYPMFVAEGTSENKLKKISRSPYLSSARKSLSAISGALCIYGFSFGESDEHILDCIRTSNVTLVAISLYGPADSDGNKKIIEAVDTITQRRPKNAKEIEVLYFDAESVPLWK